MERMNRCVAAIAALTACLAALVGCTMGDLPMREGIDQLSTADPVWKFSQKLTATNELVANAFFGYAVSISKDYAIVGARGETANTGAAYIFKRSGTTWTRLKRITPTSPVAGSYFGVSVGIDGTYAIVGAFAANMAFIFSKDQGGIDNWGEVQVLIGTASSNFGCAVAIKGLHAIVGAGGESSGQGAAYIYFRDKDGSNNWGWVADVRDSTGATGDSLGYSVSISENFAIAGAHNADSGNGRAIVFWKYDNYNWYKNQLLSLVDGIPSDAFGACVSMTDTDLIVGAVGKQYAYVFSRTGTSWGETARLFSPPPSGPSDAFGSAVSIHGNFLVIGAYGQDDNQGAIHAYNKNSGSWEASLNNPLYEQIRRVNNHFGMQSAIHDTWMIVGAPGDCSTEANAGAAYIYILGDY
ncbi:MAG TPA: hypothetical protein VMX33_09570 [bacterium]|nr:hypothetical protein [bacterium]